MPYDEAASSSVVTNQTGEVTGSARRGIDATWMVVGLRERGWPKAARRPLSVGELR